MARKELTFGDAIAPADLKVGDEVAGAYVGAREVAMAGRDKPGVVIELQGRDGPVSLWAPTSLQGIVPQLQTGTRYVFHYEGKKRNPKSGRDFHSFKVFEDDGVGIPT